MYIRHGALALAVTAALSAHASVNSNQKPAFSGAQALQQAKPHFRFPTNAHIPDSSVLYDQSGIADGIAPAQDFQSTFDAYDSEGADDFVVSDPAGWTVSAFNFQVMF